jgi:hypothetical protein
MDCEKSKKWNYFFFFDVLDFGLAARFVFGVTVLGFAPKYFFLKASTVILSPIERLQVRHRGLKFDTTHSPPFE